MKKRYWLRLLGVSCVFFTVFFPLFAAFSNVFRVHVPLGTLPRDLGMQARDVKFVTEDGLTLSGWLIPAATAPPRGAVLVVHGVGANRSDVLPRASFLTKAGYTCLLPDLRCHGESEGRRCSYGLYERLDIRASLDELKRQAPDLPIGVLAQSMGAASTILAAARCPEVKAYVLDSSFTTLWEMARENFKWMPGPILTPVQYMVSFWGSLMVQGNIVDISPEKAVADLAPRGVLFIAGDKDQLIPCEHSRRLHRIYAGPKDLFICPGAGHVESHGLCKAEFEKRVLEHFGKYLSVKTNEAAQGVENPPLPAGR
ncbi:MAG: alpha/beta fold hydrolase [Candidatus Wallbacteria bacterium]|nr:alpha/beta fold hydrolase [Candidatus Wallbacteria bacterium]